MKRIMYFLLLLPAWVHAQSIRITTASDTVCIGSNASFYATDTGVTSPHFQWLVNDLHKGSDTSVFITDSLHNGDTVLCLLTNYAGDTVFATSDSIIVTVQNKPVVSPIIYTDSAVCVGATIILSDSTAGGVWGASNGYATDSDGHVTGVTGSSGGENEPPFSDTIIYSITNPFGCISTASVVIKIDATPHAYFYFYGALCVGESQFINDGDDFQGQLYATNGNIVCESGAYIFGQTAGTDYIYNVVINACGSDTFGMNITVIGNTLLPFIESPFPNLCVGASMSLTDTSKGVFNSWYVYNKNAKIDNSGVITGMYPGLDTVVLWASSQCVPSQSTSYVINILPPEQITGFDSFCIGNPVVFTDSTTGGTWESSNNNVVTIDQSSGNVSNVTEGTAVISYSSGSCVVSKPIKINPPLPSVTGYTNLCRGVKTTLNNPLKSGIWYSSDPSIVVADSIHGIITARENGTAIITYQLSGCITTTTVSVTQGNFHLTGPTYVCANATAELSADTTGSWSTANTTIATVEAVNGTVSGISTGYATITFTAYQSQCIDTTVVMVTNCSSGANIFPNPSGYEVTIEADTGLYYAYSFINDIGQAIFHNPINAEFTTLDIHYLPAGIYFITLYGYDGEYAFKFLKE